MAVTKAGQFRELVTLLLRAEGVARPDGSAIAARPEGSPRPGERFLRPPNDLDGSDIQGLESWLLTTNYGEEHKELSKSLDRAEQLAQKEGRRFFAAIWPRRGRAASDTYAIVPLRVLADLIATTEAMDEATMQALREAQQRALADEQEKREQLAERDDEARAQHEAWKREQVQRILYGEPGS